MAASVTATFVFTDLVDSTATSARLGSEPAEKLRQTHFGLLRGAVSASGGTEVKNLGDGLMVVFSSPSRALSCAAAMQQAVHAFSARSETPLRIRVGLSTGEATEEDGDYFGTPVVEAARLCAAATGGQILATDVLRMLAGRNASQEMVTVGALELKGLPDPVEAVDVLWEPEEAADATTWPLPTRLVRGATESLFGFFGRDAELAVVEAVAKRNVTEPRVQLVWVSGEPGVGKTTLVSQATRTANAGGTGVAFGACDETSSVPFLPWISVTCQIAEHAPDALARLSPLHRQALGRLVPDLGDGTQAGAEVEQFVLFEGVAKLMESATMDRPLIVVLDDAHWADNASLDLLRHLVTRAAPMRVLVIATLRDTDLSRGDPLSRLIADMHREASVSRIQLDGLTDVELIGLMEAAAGHELEADGVTLAHALRRETNGNPFFVAEMLRHLAETGEFYLDERNRYVLRSDISELGLPTSVRDVVGRRVERLGDEAVRVLTVAAVMGREFSVEILADVADLDEDSLLDVLEAAVGAAVLTEPPDRAGRFRFAHALIQHTLYQDLGATRRQRLHARIAQAIEQRSGDEDRFVPELAYHWLAATRPAERERALHYTRRAGDLALAALAPDDAERWYRQGLELVDPDDPARGMLLVGLGRAQQMLGNPAHRDTLFEAADLAERANDANLLIAVALAPRRGIATGAAVESPLLPITEKALTAVGDRDTADRVRLQLVRCEQTDARDWRLVRDYAIAAVRSARAVGDERLVLNAVTSTYSARCQPDTLDERVRDAADAVRIADRLGDPLAQLEALASQQWALIESCDRDGSDRAVEEMQELLGDSQLPLPRYRLALAVSGQQILHGDLPGAETTANALLEIMTGAGYPDALAIYGGVLFEIRFEQGRIDEIADFIVDAARENPGLNVLRATVAFIHSELGDLESARAAFDGTDAFLDALTYDLTWFAALSNCADTAVALGDRDAAHRILHRLEPFANRSCGVAGQFHGSTSRMIGRLRALLRDDVAADAAFKEALALCQQMRAPYQIARVQLQYAEALRSREEFDARRVDQLARSAIDAARTYGYGDIERRTAAIIGNA